MEKATSVCDGDQTQQKRAKRNTEIFKVEQFLVQRAEEYKSQNVFVNIVGQVKDIF